jgi:hypothetical protein
VLKAACERRGRDFAEITLGLFMAPLDEAEANTFIDEGYSEMIYAVPAEDRDTVLAHLDRIAAFAEKIRR